MPIALFAVSDSILTHVVVQRGYVTDKDWTTFYVPLADIGFNYDDFESIGISNVTPRPMQVCGTHKNCTQFG